MKSLVPNDKFVAVYFDLLRDSITRHAKEGEKELEKGLPVTFPYTSWHMVGRRYRHLLDRSYDLEALVKAGASRSTIHSMLIEGVGF